MNRPARSAFLCFVTCAAIAGVVPRSYGDAPQAALKYASAQDLAAAVAGAKADPFVKEIAADPSATTLVIHRAKTGEVEVHTILNDIIVVESGRATMLVGGQVRGNHELKPTEWRGGEIVGGERHEVAKGDLLLIPAGTPHQCIVKSGDSVVYLTIKTPATATATGAASH